MKLSRTESTIESLRISPKYTSEDWRDLEENNPKDWVKAADIVKDRLDGRFLRFASDWLSDPHSGFVVLAIDSLLIETIQQFVEGRSESDSPGRVIRQFLEGPRFQPLFDAKARSAFYKDIRCGLLHQAEAKRMWLIRRKQEALLQKVTKAGREGYIIDVEKFHVAVQKSFNDYLKHICEPDNHISEPDNSELRSNLWVKMNYICNVRANRGGLYEAEDDVADSS
jgi:hypothetical protein